jgi:hypothetical protein
LQLNAYNGWENKFTWLVHLHLGNEQALMQEITGLVADAANDGAAGWRVQMWVKMALENWLTGYAGRDWSQDDAMRLLASDLVGSALAAADWDVLVRLLVGETMTTDNLFTLTLYQAILSCPEWQQQFSVLLHLSASVYACADLLKDWMREMLDTWLDMPSARFRRGFPFAMLVSGLLANTFEVICWQHVVRAFRPEY